MLRFLAGAAACFLLLTGAFLIWQSRAASGPSLPGAPPARPATLFGDGEPLQAPEASAKTREEKRFARYDKDKDGKVETMEYLAARQRNFAKLDLDHNGALSFQEYAVKGIEKFKFFVYVICGWLLKPRPINFSYLFAELVHHRIETRPYNLF